MAGMLQLLQGGVDGLLAEHQRVADVGLGDRTRGGLNGIQDPKGSVGQSGAPGQTPVKVLFLLIGAVYFSDELLKGQLLHDRAS